MCRRGGCFLVIAYGGMVQPSEAAAEAAAQGGISCEVIDLRSIVPLDIETIIKDLPKRRVARRRR